MMLTRFFLPPPRHAAVPLNLHTPLHITVCIVHHLLRLRWIFVTISVPASNKRLIKERMAVVVWLNERHAMQLLDGRRHSVVLVHIIPVAVAEEEDDNEDDADCGAAPVFGAISSNMPLRCARHHRECVLLTPFHSCLLAIRSHYAVATSIHIIINGMTVNDEMERRMKRAQRISTSVMNA